MGIGQDTEGRHFTLGKYVEGLEVMPQLQDKHRRNIVTHKDFQRGQTPHESLLGVC